MTTGPGVAAAATPVAGAMLNPPGWEVLSWAMAVPEGCVAEVVICSFQIGLIVQSVSNVAGHKARLPGFSQYVCQSLRVLFWNSGYL